MDRDCLNRRTGVVDGLKAYPVVQGGWAGLKPFLDAEFYEGVSGHRFTGLDGSGSVRCFSEWLDKLPPQSRYQEVYGKEGSWSQTSSEKIIP